MRHKKSGTQESFKIIKPIFTPRTEHQKQLVEIIDKSVITIVNGPAGSGKTFVSAAIGLQMLMRKDIERLIITRPAVEAGENLGYLPGSHTEKLRPYMDPIFDVLNLFLGYSDINTLQNNGKIVISPLAYMRGRTFDNCMIIVDEAQNCTMKQLKMAITRVGQNSKIIVNGDTTQSDISNNTALETHIIKLRLVDKRISVFEFDNNDIIRNEVIDIYLEAMNICLPQ